MAPKTRNSEVLASFVAYCQAHPTQRFWQALRNWSGDYNFIYLSNVSPFLRITELKAAEVGQIFIDTFSWEGRDG